MRQRCILLLHHPNQGVGVLQRHYGGLHEQFDSFQLQHDVCAKKRLLILKHNGPEHDQLEQLQRQEMGRGSLG